MKQSVDRTIKIVQHKKPTIEITQSRLLAFIKNELPELIKQQIKDAYNQGYRDGLEDYYLKEEFKEVSEYSNAEDYFNQTFIK
jgi:hypothetical protein